MSTANDDEDSASPPHTAAPSIASPLEAGSDVSDHQYLAYLDETRSVTASIMNYIEDYGRTYHRYKEGSYKFPNDEQEKDRLDRQYHVFKLLWDGRLHFCPLNDPSNILDIGTGTGIWPIEMADYYPQCQITGTDLSAIQPDSVPENVLFEIDDATETDWARPLNHYDMIRTCFMLGSFTSYPTVLRTAYSHLRPGTGWMECIEPDPMPKADDDSIARLGPIDANCYPFRDHAARLCEASVDYCDPPRPLRIAHRLSTWFRRAGFVDIHEEVYKVPVNPWAKDKKLKLVGRWQEEIWCDGLAGFSYQLLGRDGMGWTKEEIEVELVGVRESVKRRDVHAWNAVHVVWGRRPSREEEAEMKRRRAARSSR
ncbi:MAG: hypothetical protein Q9227_008013 [Pyrenula ochraceoflavens]